MAALSPSHSQLLAAPQPVMAVGLDFGTHASGFAYAALAPTGGPPPGGCRVQLHTAWPDQPAPQAKTRSAVLYRGSRLEAWGWTAWRRWSELSAAQRAAHCYTYLENFKLLLRDEDGGAGGGRVLSTVCPLPRGMTAVTVARDFLREMRKYVEQHLEAASPPGGLPFHPDLVRWCLTVPAMWSEGAKARMREAAHLAGLTRVRDSPLLHITLEPEAAALAAALDAVMPAAPQVPQGAAAAAAAAAHPVPPGEVLLVVDCGGGTTDVTLHEVLRAEPAGGAGAGRGQGPAVRLAEAAVGAGDLAGGCYVDEALWALAAEVVGPAAWADWKEAEPADWMRLRTEWELAKFHFCGGGNKDLRQKRWGISIAAHAGVLVPRAAAGVCFAELPLPASLVQALGLGLFQELTTRYADPTNALPCLRPDARTLLLPGPLLEARVFGPVVERVLRLAAGVAAEGSGRGKAPTKVLLAGGFACSPLLQRRVRTELLPGLGLRPAGDLLLPQRPGAAVVQGAVLYGTCPTVVAARRCRKTYGVAVAAPWCTEYLSSFELRGYPEKEWHDEEERHYAKVFDLFVKRGQLVRADEVVTHGCSPLTKTAHAVSIELYACEQPDARYLQEPGMVRRASVTLPLPAGWADTEEVRQGGSSAYQLEAELRFGATELQLRARDVATGREVATTTTWEAE